jgi:hypothetical protein
MRAARYSSKNHSLRASVAEQYRTPAVYVAQLNFRACLFYGRETKAGCTATSAHTNTVRMQANCTARCRLTLYSTGKHTAIQFGHKTLPQMEFVIQFAGTLITVLTTACHHFLSRSRGTQPTFSRYISRRSILILSSASSKQSLSFISLRVGMCGGLL